MRSKIPFTIILYAFLSHAFLNLNAELHPGFDAQECRDMLSLCNTFTFYEIYGYDSVMIPEGYEKYYTSEPLGMDNMFQLYRKGDVAVLCFRGSTNKKISWLANLHAAMIPAQGKITGDLGELPYCFAKTEGATVHSGYALAIAYLAVDLRKELLKLHYEGVKDLLITGHSQGGALANLLMAIFNNHVNDTANIKTRYKIYAFAAPMTGNTVFVNEYNHRYCKTGWSFNIVNPADPIPKLPIPVKDKDTITVFNYIKSLHPNKENISLNLLIRDIFNSDLTNFVTREILSISKSARKEIKKELGTNVIFPAFTHNIDYVYVGNKIELKPFEYPEGDENIKESRLRQYRNSLIGKRETRLERRFINENGSWSFQHKPYNYYVGFLNKYFKDDYKTLEMKYLPENL